MRIVALAFTTKLLRYDRVVTADNDVATVVIGFIYALTDYPLFSPDPPQVTLDMVTRVICRVTKMRNEERSRGKKQTKEI